MYNITINLGAANAVNNLLAESTCTTPRTPEILNSLIAMTNPLDNYTFNNNGGDSKDSNGAIGPLLLASNVSSDSNSSSSSQIESPTTNPPSIQHTCSQLIKAGLKLSIEQKRKHQNDGDDLLDLDKVKRVKKNECSESEEDKAKNENGIQNWNYWYENDDCFTNNSRKLTPEDEERRRRRRERNKIAATKCRLKKRERTANLMQESETLESQNIDLKNQVRDLKEQQRTLLDMLTIHRPLCQHNIGPATKDHLYRLPPVSSVMENHSYSRSDNNSYSTINNNASNNSYSRLDATTTTLNATVQYSNNMKMNLTPPSIIIEEAVVGDDDFDAGHFTDLDAYNYTIVGGSGNNSASQCHQNYQNQAYGNGAAGLDNGCMA